MTQLVKDIMKFPVVSIEPVISVKEAATLMERENVGCIVISRDNKPMGILTERDLVRKVISRGKDQSTPVSDVMTTPVVTVEPELSIWELVQLMKRNGIHRVPVVKDVLKGIVTTKDVANHAHFDTTDVNVKKTFEEVLLRIDPTKSLTANI